MLHAPPNNSTSFTHHNITWWIVQIKNIISFQFYASHTKY